MNVAGNLRRFQHVVLKSRQIQVKNSQQRQSNIAFPQFIVSLSLQCLKTTIDTAMPNHFLLSKTLSHMLRHEPEKYGIELQPGGWCSIRDVLKALKQSSSTFDSVERQDIQDMVDTQSKRRHQIVGDNIRAVYGHSVDAHANLPSSVPPDTLYHGTTSEALQSILASGLNPMKRQFVHLYDNPEATELVAQRHGNNTVILRIDAKGLSAAGQQFFHAEKNIWLTSRIEPQWLDVCLS